MPQKYFTRTKGSDGDIDDKKEQDRKAKATCQLEVQNTKLVDGPDCG